MKWLLITTRLKLNPGDQMIRFGVTKLVRAVDPAAEIEILAKDRGEDLARRRPFDRAILCGMPLWWDSPAAHCAEVGWWGELIRGWPSEEKRKFLVLGAGAATGVEMADPDRYLEAVKWVIGRAWMVTTRATVVDWPHLVQSICPAAFAVTPGGRPGARRKFVNLMSEGAHDQHFDEEEAAAWRLRIHVVARWALSEGFEAIAHDDAEADLANALGFSRIVRRGPVSEYLEEYEQCGVYVGNRLHGALAAAAAGAKCLAIGYDSRIRMLDRFNVLQARPSEVTAGYLDAFLRARHAPDLTLRMIRTELLRNLEIVRAFAAPG